MRLEYRGEDNVFDFDGDSFFEVVDKASKRSSLLFINYF
jgi:hypothetical protein